MRLGLVLALSIVAATALAQRAPRPGPNAALATALAACIPGRAFADCTSALDAAHAPAVGGAHDSATVRTVALRAPWLDVRIDADAHGVITRLHFEGRHRGVAVRRRLYDLFDRALPPPLPEAAGPAGGCGIGPAWFEDDAARGAARPALQLGVEPIAPLPDMAGDPAHVFVHARGPDQTVHLCVTSAAPPFAAAFAAFLGSAAF